MDESLMSSGVRPRYAKAVCTRFCLQHEVMRACDCFHTQLEMALMNVTKFPFKNGLRFVIFFKKNRAVLQCRNYLFFP